LGSWHVNQLWKIPDIRATRADAEFMLRRDASAAVAPFSARRGEDKMSVTQVLCVESHPEYQEALSYMLKIAGYRVMSATTGTQALKLLQREPIQGVLLEYDLPDATGTAVRAEMKRIKPDVPILLFNGVGAQTPFLLRFFDSYVRNSGRPDWAFQDLEVSVEATGKGTESERRSHET
jgi:CheY-like chemotaxis protein